MPSRMLKDWTNSDKVNSITANAEVFFTRLIMKADDYGCFWADVKRLKANLYPLKSDSTRDADILRWLDECQKAEMIVIYESDNKKYLQILEFGQRLRQKKSKFPMPTNVSNMRTDDSKLPPEEEEEKKKKVEEEGNFSPTRSGWNTKPTEAELSLPLPEITEGAVIQLFSFSKNITASKEQVAGLWNIFKAQNFNGEKFYQTTKQVYSHFISWCKFQDLKSIPVTAKKIDTDQTAKHLDEVYGPSK